MCSAIDIQLYSIVYSIVYSKKLKEVRGQSWPWQSLQKHVKMTSNCIFVDGLGLELRIFNLTHQKRSEAKVDLRGHFKNMSKWLQISHLVDGLGLELRLFNLTQQKRSEAKVDLGGHFKNMSKWLQITYLWLVWDDIWEYSIWPA